MATAPNFHNIGNYMVSVAYNLFMGNIGTLGTHNDKLDEILDQNQNLTSSWTSGTPEATGSDLQAQINNILFYAATNPDGSPNPNANPDTEASLLNTFVGTYLGAGGTIPVSEFTQGVGSQLLKILASVYKQVDGIESGQGSVDSTTINSFNGIVSAQGNNEEQTGQNLGKTEGSVVQADAGAQQTFTGIVDAVEGFVSIVASLLQQLYS